MARPRKKEIDKQTRQLPSVRCTEREYALICSRCEQVDMCISAYLRQVALNPKIVVRKSMADPELVFQLRKLAVNINQQTRTLHQTGEAPRS